MNKIEDKEILVQLEKNYNILCNYYGEDKILGIFVTGLANYGFCEYEDELKYTAIFLPSFEEMCTLSPVNDTLKGIKIIDLRCIYDISLQQDWNSLELLYSNYIRINKKYASMFNRLFFIHKDEFAVYDPFIRVHSAKVKAVEALSKGNHFEAARLIIASKIYTETEDDYKKCFYIDKPYYESYLWSIKEFKQRVDAETLEEDFNEIILEAARKKKNPDAANILKKGVTEILTYCNLYSDNLKNFLALLTKKETEALEHLLKIAYGKEEILQPIKQLCEDSGVSRMGWNTLLEKMKNYKIAKTTNRGKYGLLIEFTVPCDEILYVLTEGCK